MTRWLRQKTYFWQEAPLFRPFLFLICGIVCYDQLRGSTNSTSLILLLTSGILLVTLPLLQQHRRWMEVVYALALPAFFGSFGWCIYDLSDAGAIKHSALFVTDSNAVTLVRIKEDPLHRGATTRLLVTPLETITNTKTQSPNGDAWVYIYSDRALFSEGDSLLVPAKWQDIANRGNPFEFDDAQQQRRRGITHRQFVSVTDVMAFGKADHRQRPRLGKAHDWCNKQLKTYIKDSAALGLLQAMLLGDESGFDPELRQAYSQTGVIHIVSISGSHVAVLYLVVTWLLFWVKGRRGHWLKYLTGIILVWLYVLIAGGPPSAMRSALMFTVLAASTLSGREGNSLNTIIGAAFGLLLYQPAWLFSVGFQLSFAAVLSIMIFYPPIYSLWYWPKRKKVTKWIWQALAASFAAEILTAPIVIYYFHNFPLLFLFANLLAATLVGLCALVGGMAVIAFCWLPGVANTIGWAVSFLVRVFNAAIVWLQGLNVAALQRLQINPAELVLLYLVIIGIGVWWLAQRRHGCLLALAATCSLLILLDYDHYLALKQQRLIVYNGGKKPAVEVIQGKFFQPLIGDANNYSTAMAHIGFHACQAGNNVETPYFTIANKTILVLNDSTFQPGSAPLPADVLVLARPLRFLRIGEMLDAIRPKEVVLAGRPSAYHLQRWKDSCTAHNIRFHNVAAQGAFILE